MRRSETALGPEGEQPVVFAGSVNVGYYAAVLSKWNDETNLAARNLGTTESAPESFLGSIRQKERYNIPDTRVALQGRGCRN